MDESIRKLFDPSALPAREEVGDVEHPDLQRFHVYPMGKARTTSSIRRS